MPIYLYYLTFFFLIDVYISIFLRITYLFYNERFNRQQFDEVIIYIYEITYNEIFYMKFYDF